MKNHEKKGGKNPPKKQIKRKMCERKYCFLKIHVRTDGRNSVEDIIYSIADFVCFYLDNDTVFVGSIMKIAHFQRAIRVCGERERNQVRKLRKNKSY